MNTIIYVHGYGSSASGNKAQTLRKLMPDYNVVGNTYNYDTTAPSKIISDVVSLCFEYGSKGSVFLLGSSMGGFIVCNVLKKINTKAVLINPSLSPETNMITRRNRFAREYAKLSQALNPNGYSNTLCFLTSNDDVIDSEKIKRFNFNLKIVNGGGHTMTNFDTVIPQISKYYGTNTLLEEIGLTLK